MSHDVFIGYSSKGDLVAEAICSALEAQNIQCWFAKRDRSNAEIGYKEINSTIQSSRADGSDPAG